MLAKSGGPTNCYSAEERAKNFLKQRLKRFARTLGFDVVTYCPFLALLNEWRITTVLDIGADAFVRPLFRHGLYNTTNAFKASRKEVIDGISPIFSPHFNITVELPLKAIVRGYNFTVISITWRNRRTGVTKLKLSQMGSRYLFIVLYVWLEKYFSLRDYRKPLTSETRLPV